MKDVIISGAVGQYCFFKEYQMDRNLALELVRVTEAAALACGRWVGKGDKMSADEAATEAMRRTLDAIEISGTVVIGEGEMDQAPMLYIGERLGRGNGQDVDIAVDPLEGTNICAKGLNGSIATIALSPKGGFLHAPDMYMEKIAVGPTAKGAIDINASPATNLQRVADAKSVTSKTSLWSFSTAPDMTRLLKKSARQARAFT